MPPEDPKEDQKPPDQNPEDLPSAGTPWDRLQPSSVNATPDPPPFPSAAVGLDKSTATGPLTATGPDPPPAHTPPHFHTTVAYTNTNHITHATTPSYCRAHLNTLARTDSL